MTRESVRNPRVGRWRGYTQASALSRGCGAVEIDYRALGENETTKVIHKKKATSDALATVVPKGATRQYTQRPRAPLTLGYTGDGEVLIFVGAATS